MWTRCRAARTLHMSWAHVRLWATQQEIHQWNGSDIADNSWLLISLLTEVSRLKAFELWRESTRQKEVTQAVKSQRGKKMIRHVAHTGCTWTSRHTKTSMSPWHWSCLLCVHFTAIIEGRHHIPLGGGGVGTLWPPPEKVQPGAARCGPAGLNCYELFWIKVWVGSSS